MLYIFPVNVYSMARKCFRVAIVCPLNDINRVGWAVRGSTVTSGLLLPSQNFPVLRKTFGQYCRYGKMPCNRADVGGNARICATAGEVQASLRRGPTAA